MTDFPTLGLRFDLAEITQAKTSLSSVRDAYLEVAAAREKAQGTGPGAAAPSQGQQAEISALQQRIDRYTQLAQIMRGSEYEGVQAVQAAADQKVAIDRDAAAKRLKIEQDLLAGRNAALQMQLSAFSDITASMIAIDRQRAAAAAETQAQISKVVADAQAFALDAFQATTESMNALGRQRVEAEAARQAEMRAVITDANAFALKSFQDTTASMIALGRQREAALAEQSAQAYAAAERQARMSNTPFSVIATGQTVDPAGNFLKQLGDQSAAGATLSQYQANLKLLKADELGVVEAAAPMIDAMTRTDEVMHRVGGSSFTVRETLVSLREVMRGDFSRLAGTMTILGQQFGLVKLLLDPVVLGIGALAAAGIAAAVAVEKMEEEQAKWANTLEATSNAVGVSKEALTQWAQQIAAATDNTVGSVSKTLQVLVATGQTSSAGIQDAGEAATKLADLTGQKTEAVAQQLAGMYGHVADGAAKLNEQVHFLTLAQYDQIDALEKSGDKTGAWALAMKDLDDHLKNSSVQMSYWQKSIHDAHVELDKLLDSMAKLITGGPIADQVAHQVAVVNNLQSMPSIVPGQPEMLQAAQSKLLDLQQQYYDSMKQADRAKEQSAQDARQQALIASTQSYEAEDKQLKGNTALIKEAQDKYRAAVEGAVAEYQKQGKPLPAQLAYDSSHMSEQLAAIAKRMSPATRQGPTDQADQVDAQVRAQIAQLDSQIASARKTQLDAAKRLATSDAEAAAIQDQIDQADYDKTSAGYTRQIAQIDGQIAAIKAKKLDTHSQQQITDLQSLEQGYRELAEDALLTKIMKDIVDARTQEKLQAQRKVDSSNLSLQAQIDTLTAQQQLSKSTYAQKVIDDEIQKLKEQQAIALQETVVANTDNVDQKAIEQKRLDNMKAAAAAEDGVRAADIRLIDAVQEATSHTSNFASAIASHNWAQAFDSLIATIQTVEKAFATQGMGGGLAAGAGAISGLVSGHGGALGGIGTGLNVGLGVSMLGGSIGAGLSSLGAAGAIATGGTALTGLMTGLGAMLTNPITAVVAGIAALAFSLLGNKKPSNFTATAQFSGIDGVQYGGDKPNDNTTKLIQAVGSGILTAEQQIEQLGIKLGATVQTINIGQRDPSKIVLSNGTTVSAPAGDTAGATDAALKAVLQNATYVDAAEKKLVDSMIAAGDGFDQISQALQNYNTAQAALKGIDSQIQQLADPLGYAISQVTTSIQAQQDTLSQALDGGLITAQQYQQAIAKLGQLEQLQLKQATDQSLQTQLSAVTTAQNNLNTAYTNAAQTIQTTKAAWDTLVTSLTTFKGTLTTGALAQASPLDQYTNTKAIFESTAAKAKAGDQTAAGQLQQVGTDFLNASKAFYATTAPYYQDLAEVKTATDAALGYAQTQSSLAQKQLDALNAQTSGLTTINASVLSVGDAIKALAAAQAAYAAAQAQSTAAAQAAAAAAAKAAADAASKTAANDNGSGAQDWNKLLAARPDVMAAYTQAAAQAAGGNKDAIASLKEKGITSAQTYAQWWYNSGGGAAQYHFANGAAFDGGRLVNSPTNFSIGQMGEAGPEGVFPLTRTSSGKLGIHVTQSAVDMGPLLAEVKALRQQMVGVAGYGAQQQINGLQALKDELASLRREMRQQRQTKTAKAA